MRFNVVLRKACHYRALHFFVSAVSKPVGYQPATPFFEEFEMELLIGFLTTVCISLLIFRT
jgi:hypothetical protein